MPSAQELSTSLRWIISRLELKVEASKLKMWALNAEQCFGDLPRGKEVATLIPLLPKMSRRLQQEMFIRLV